MTDPTRPGRDRFADYKDLLDSYGFRPSRKLGQNFLLDPTLHRFLVDTIAPTEDDFVLEIGPGLGFLTREIASRCRVLAVEIDDRLVRVLEGEIPRFPIGSDRVTLLHRDVLSRGGLHDDVQAAIEVGCAALEAAGRFLVIANLPYSVSGPAVAELAMLARPPVEWTLLVQLEMAERLAAPVGTKQYGALTAFVQLAYSVRVVRKVGAQVFRPRPNVDSGVARLSAREGGTLGRSGAERRELMAFLRGLFSARRKKLRNAPGVAALVGDPEWRDVLEQRPDAVEPSALLRLFDAVVDSGR